LAANSKSETFVHKKDTSNMKRLVQSRPLLTYLVLSYGFFWLFLALCAVVLLSLGLNPATLPSWLSPLLTIVGAWMPTVAAMTVTGILDGRAAIQRLIKGFIQFHIPFKWYLAALIPWGLAFVGAGFYRLGGGSASGGVSLSPGFWGGLIIINLLSGPTGEEAGWRGFALPRLLKSYSPLKSGIILGAIWDFWHLPLWIIGGSTWQYCLAFSIGIISLSVLMTWIFCKTPNSLVPMTIIHFSYNASLTLIGPQGIGVGSMFPLAAIVAMLCLLTAMIVWATGGLKAGSAPQLF
jgi:membrane protease YdiL (CAAX protease family)